MRVLVIEALRKPEVREIHGTLESMQQLVGGGIQTIYPFDDPVAIVANDEGKVLGMLPNRGLWDDAGELYDVICGTFFICGLTDDGLGSLTDEQIKKHLEMYENPELFVRVNGKIFCLPLTMEEAEKWRQEYES